MKLRATRNYFLIELVANCFLFALCAAVCVMLFAQAHQKSEQGYALSMATIHAQNTAEAVIATQGNLSRMCELLGGTNEQGEYTQFFNQDWKAATHKEAVYTLTAILRAQDGLIYARIEVMQAQSCIYALDVVAQEVAL